MEWIGFHKLRCIKHEAYIMKRLNNPFVIYGYKGAEYFCDREKETQTIINGLENERNITLMAPRRMGKTGLIHHVFERINQQHQDVYCFYVDIFATKNLDQFVKLLAQSILGGLDTPGQAALRKVTELFSNLRPTMTFDSVTGIPAFSVDIAPGEGEVTLRQIFDYLRKLEKRCYIGIDEFQQITTYPEKGAEALLRSYIQFIPNAYFIFAGSEQHLMADMFLSAKRPFYQSSQMVQLKEIPEATYLDFANAFFRKKGMEIPSETFNFLYRKVDGQTWYIQAILNRLYANFEGVISQSDIESSISDLIEEQAMAFENYYASLTTNQVVLLKAIAQEGRVRTPMSQVFMRKYRLPALSSVRMALKALTDRQFIYRYDDAYTVYDRFFGMWLRRVV